MASAAETPSPSASASAESTGSTDGSTAGSAATDNGKRGGHKGGDRGQLAADLATKLGVEEAKVTEAIQAFREANKPAEGTARAEGTAPAENTRPDRSATDAALAKSLAESLGVEESKVTAALEEIRAASQAERAAALKTRLDQAVTDGKLTQAEADAVTKAVESGVIGGGGR
jgi:Spy/CpxP family protein refolding chaperone